MTQYQPIRDAVSGEYFDDALSRIANNQEFHNNNRQPVTAIPVSAPDGTLLRGTGTGVEALRGLGAGDIIWWNGSEWRVLRKGTAGQAIFATRSSVAFQNVPSAPTATSINDGVLSAHGIV